ncbi:MAG: hypothetical protein QW171_04175 [Candidatus Bilamarchaeaceae archaeon]
MRLKYTQRCKFADVDKRDGERRQLFIKRFLRKALTPLVTIALASPPAGGFLHSKPVSAESVKTSIEGTTVDGNAKKLANLSLSGQVFTNEGGAAIGGRVSYNRWIGGDFGVITFGELTAPYFVLSTAPGLEMKGVKFGYLGKLGFTHLNSYLHTSHSLYLGYGKQFANWGFDIGAIAGGALSYPTYDNIYANIMGGVSFNIKETVYLYTLVQSYLAAGNAMQTAYVGYYTPKFQGVEGGVVLKLNDMIGKLYYGYERIQSKAGFLFGTEFKIIKKLKGRVSGGLGFTHLSPELGGRTDLMAQAFLSLHYITDSGMRQSYTATYERYQPGGIPLQTDINSPPNLRPLTPQERTWEEEAKANLLASNGSMADFAARYEGASKEEIITVARWLSRTLAEVAYANKAEEALMQWKFFDQAVKDVANASYDDILGFLKRYVEWYETHGTYEGMPEELKNGITMCTGIHALTALFLKKNGIGAAAFAVSTTKEPHVVVGYWTDTETGIIDYGDIFVGPSKSLDQVIRAYGLYRKAPSFVMQVFAPKENGKWDYLGTWITPEGRLLNNVFGTDNAHVTRIHLLELPGY